METYSEKLKSPKWQRKRLEIMKRDKFKCVKCGDEETTLNVHHKVYHDGLEPWEYENSDLATLCEDCHREIEILIKGSENLDFDNIKIFKNVGWTNNSYIMFISYNDICCMRIYSDKKERIIGFNFSDYWDAKKIIKMFKSVGC